MLGFDPIAAAGFSALLLIAAATLMRMRLTVIWFLVYNMTLVLLGLILLTAQGSATTAAVWTYALGFAALLAGYRLRIRPLRTEVAERDSSASVKFIPRAPLRGAVAISGILGLYHLLAVGIPLLSPSIEVDRFDVTSSGLFGIPGRMYLYGIPLCWLGASVNAQLSNHRWREDTTWRVATMFYIATATLSGFKSGLLAAAFTMIVGYTVICGVRLNVGGFLRRYALALCIPAVYAYSVAQTYTTYAQSGRPLSREILDRLTVGAAQPVQYALEGRIGGNIGNGVLNDMHYFLGKYTGHGIATAYSFERAVSAEIVGANPASGAWTPPVTIGGFAELVYSFGAFAAVVAVFMLGYTIARAYNGAPRNGWHLLARATLVFTAYNWLIKGGLVYWAVNMFAVAAMLLATGLAISLLSRPLKGSSERVPRTRRPTIGSGARTKARALVP